MGHLISLQDLSRGEIERIFSLAAELKNDRQAYASALSGRAVVLIFEKPSLRTRVSFEVGIRQLGGNAIYLGQREINLDVREPVPDVARTLSRYVEAAVLRTYNHKVICEFAQCADIAVVNALSDLFHPCQALTDVWTLREGLQRKDDITLAYVGDGNNVCHSLMFACAKTGINLNIATPERYRPRAEITRQAREAAPGSGAQIKLFSRAQEAVEGADAVYTDVWVSMGQEEERERRLKEFQGFQVNRRLLSLAKKDCLVMHCLPAHRGEEVGDGVLDDKNSLVFDQAENRLHLQKAVLISLLTLD
ncbi:MAG: ornithine carbamoyltransferase [Candidatus Omnitrophota bacterium]